MFGKAFKSMYEGSMYGAGTHVFGVWNYAIANAYDSRVELNPNKLKDTLGDTLDRMEKAIAYLCQPDPKSRNPAHEGRKLVPDGQFQFFMPSWAEYRRIKSEEERRAYNADYKRRKREEQKRKKGLPLPGETAYVNAIKTQPTRELTAQIAREEGERMQSIAEKEKASQEPQPKTCEFCGKEIPVGTLCSDCAAI